MTLSDVWTAGRLEELTSDSLDSPLRPAAATVLKTLLLTDLVDSTRLFETLGDQQASEVSARHDHLARRLTRELGGREIDKADGFLLLFEHPIEAVCFAVAFHDGLAELSARMGVQLTARCGIHLGEVVLRHNAEEDVARGAKPLEVEGLAKPAAARVMSLAAGRQTLITRGAFDLARRAAVGEVLAEYELRWLAHGPYLFHGVDEPQEIFEVGAVGIAPLEVPPDSPKVRRAVRPGEELTLGWRPAPALAVPRRAHWKLQEKLGEGGFGEVWLARHQGTGGARVFKFCYEAERLRSLQREVTLFRLLKDALGDRDDISKLIDWSFDQAPYFLESEYTEGGNLGEWATEQGGVAAVPLAQRLELVAQVAEALAAAHSVGVLHKDVKPGNILITPDSEGQPRAVLTDFGVGMLTDAEQLAKHGITRLGLTAIESVGMDSSTGGTQIYLAPELQAGAAPAVQADIYALGVVLYQLVVEDLERPLAPGWRRDIKDELLRSDIADFADGSPGRRPRSALEVAERLRSLDERREKLEAERRLHQEAERAQRRRRLLSVVASVASVFLVVVSVLAWQAIQARDEAEKGRAQAEELIDYMVLDLRESLQRIGRVDLLEGVARSAQRYFEQLPPAEDTPDQRQKRGMTMLSIGSVLLEQGDTDGALSAYTDAENIFDAVGVEDLARAAALRGEVQSLLGLGEVVFSQGKDDEARRRFEAGLAVAEQLRQVAGGTDFESAEARYWIAKILQREGLVEEAIKLCEQSLALLAAPLDATKEFGAWRRGRLRIDDLVLLARLHSRQGRRSKVIENLAAADQFVEEQLAVDPANVAWSRKQAWIQIESGELFLSMDEAQRALAAYQAARESYSRLERSDRESVSWKAAAAQSLVGMARASNKLDDHSSAIELLLLAKPVFTRLSEQDPTRLYWFQWLASVEKRIGTTYIALNDYPRAIGAYERSQVVREHLVELRDGAHHEVNYLSWHHVVTGNLYQEIGDDAAARKHWQRAVALIEPVVAESEALDYLDTYAQALKQLGHIDEARLIEERLRQEGYGNS